MHERWNLVNKLGEGGNFRNSISDRNENTWNMH